MSSVLPVIVGFGGYNAAGRSSGHQAFRRMVIDSLDGQTRRRTLAGLGSIMGLSSELGDEQAILDGTLVRRIEKSHFDPDKVPISKKLKLDTEAGSASFVLSIMQMPETIPDNWHVEPTDVRGRKFHVFLKNGEEVKLNTVDALPVKTAGQLPSGFDPAEHYRSLHHPRGLQMAILGASDAVRSMGVEWSHIAGQLSPDQISVYSASLMSQLDDKGFGGLFAGRLDGGRASSKQVALGLNTMPADFINAYVLGSMGSTGGTAGACATFLYNLRQGVEDIRSGRRQVAVIGASEAPILPEIIDGYGAMGALATDAELRKLDGTDVPNHRRASRPFGENCGFTLAESSQYVILMSEELAMATGARIYGAVPAVYVNADGYKKSISAPGAGNYITMAKALGLTRTLLGDESLRCRSLVQAHGSSTPQNRVTESRILHQMAETFGIERWPVGAVKAYLGHTLSAASGDQLTNSLGVFEYGLLPGIKTIGAVADDVLAQRLSISNQDQEFERGSIDTIFLNSKGFGGNNATAAIFSPEITEQYLIKRYGRAAITKWQKLQEGTDAANQSYQDSVDKGQLNAIYEFGNHLVDEADIKISPERLDMPGFKHSIPLDSNEGFEDF